MRGERREREEEEGERGGQENVKRKEGRGG